MVIEKGNCECLNMFILLFIEFGYVPNVFKRLFKDTFTSFLEKKLFFNGSFTLWKLFSNARLCSELNARRNRNIFNRKKKI